MSTVNHQIFVFEKCLSLGVGVKILFAFWGWVGPSNNGPARAHRTDMCFEDHAKDPPEWRMGYDAGVWTPLKQLLGD